MKDQCDCKATPSGVVECDDCRHLRLFPRVQPQNMPVAGGWRWVFRAAEGGK